MNINIKDIITLDGLNEYVVVSKTKYNGIIYYYLININDYNDMLICYEKDDELIEVEDNKLILELSPLFYKETQNILKEYNKK